MGYPRIHSLFSDNAGQYFKILQGKIIASVMWFCWHSLQDNYIKSNDEKYGSGYYSKMSHVSNKGQATENILAPQAIFSPNITND